MVVTSWTTNQMQMFLKQHRHTLRTQKDLTWYIKLLKSDFDVETLGHMQIICLILNPTNKIIKEQCSVMI